MTHNNPTPDNHRDYDHENVEETPFFPFSEVLMKRDHTPTSDMEEMNNDFVKQAGMPSTTSDSSQTN